MPFNEESVHRVLRALRQGRWVGVRHERVLAHLVRGGHEVKGSILTTYLTTYGAQVGDERRRTAKFPNRRRPSSYLIFARFLSALAVAQKSTIFDLQA